MGTELLIMLPSLLISLLIHKEERQTIARVWGISAGIASPILFIIGYAACLPMTLKSGTAWMIVLTASLVPLVVMLIASYISDDGDSGMLPLHMVLTVGIVVVIGLFTYMSGSELFNASSYSKLLKTSEGKTSDIPSAESSKAIALMDTESASKLGDRKIGSLTDVVSQYEIDKDDYEQINYKGRPVKVAPLRYADIFKWSGNKDKGVPGYVIVDPTSMDAKFVRLDKGMKYVPSAHFSQNLNRHILSEYPNVLLINTHFEIDEDGKPYYVSTKISHPISVFGGTKVEGVFVTDPVTGKITYYSAGKVPSWIDEVYPAEVICENYNYSVQLSKGFWNSVIGQQGCKKVTEMKSDDDDDDSAEVDYGYIAKDNDIYIFTGVTSVRNDASNLGFLLANERTGKAEYIECAGADEKTAMNAAEGTVQDMKYTAAFPSLVLEKGQPVYIMTLRDKSLITKGYACVGAEDYSKIAVADTQEECIDKYKRLISGGGDTDISLDGSKDTSDSASGDAVKKDYKPVTVTVDKVLTLDKDGNTYLYIRGKDNKWYHAVFADVLDLADVKTGDIIKIEAADDGSFIMEYR